ncbi:MAG: hypothetical protein NC911_02640 [Candidatus Omnitrophica bacterium]|nr:hypothetical protein [Candidatus Omnitrophota bacterium]
MGGGPTWSVAQGAKSHPLRNTNAEEKRELMAKLVSFLYQLARRLNDLETILSGNPKRIARRIKNKYLGRKILSKIYRWPKF